MLSPSDKEDLLQYVGSEIHDRLSGPDGTLAQVDYPLMLDDVIHGSIDDDRVDDFSNDVIPEHIRPLLQLGTETEAGIALELLDLGTGCVFVLLHADGIPDGGPQVVAEMATGDTEAVREYVRFRIGHEIFDGEWESSRPEVIEIDDPVTRDDVRGVFRGILIPNRDECRKYVDFVTSVSGRHWPIESFADRERFVEAYLTIALGEKVEDVRSLDAGLSDTPSPNPSATLRRSGAKKGITNLTDPYEQTHIFDATLCDFHIEEAHDEHKALQSGDLEDSE